MRGRLLGVVAAWAALVAGVIAALHTGLADRLPGAVAVHWSGSGADRSQSTGAFLAQTLVFWGVMAVVAIPPALSSLVAARRAARRRLLAYVFGAGGFVIAMYAITLLANLDLADWREARLPAIGFGYVIGAAALGVLAGWLAGTPGPDRAPETDAQAGPTIVLRPGERAVWVSRTSNLWLATGGAALAVAAAVFAMAAAEAAAAASVGPVLVIAVVGAFLSTVRVRADEHGLSVGFGPFGWPARRIALDRIERAWTEDRSAMRAGGYGVRGLPGATTVMIRGGRCLVVRLRDGGTFAVSVDDAENGAALLNALAADGARV
ncbi:DUF1648 domain-containing protein [Bailinhaonella thermotolerans]|uniref:DUF1648 domain-containing protein n=1 Tax=Bailinhaonella thermotolerans TaxID=1070861 RepID=A0A3A4B0A0_9ACTN|nr:DUF1648 domain-containing protein [Bailinhaonella thermotolerans]RJL31447.1 DUF1648 domain-containing protein [Bailinhaonella thermotolerans]